jgi:DNA-binding NarL/FixJ family response regulator
MIRIVIVEDHPVVREGIKQILAADSTFSVVAESSDGEAALNVLRIQACDVVLLDISLPGMNGVEVLKRIRAEHPALPTLALSVHSDEEYGVRMLRSGAAGYLMKGSMTSRDLLTAIRKAIRGERYVSPALAEHLAFAFQFDREQKPARAILSDREYQTMRMLANGKTVGEIAAELCLSAKTVSTYRSRILQKLQFKNNSELIRYAIKEELAS